MVVSEAEKWAGIAKCELSYFSLSNQEDKLSQLAASSSAATQDNFPGGQATGKPPSGPSLRVPAASRRRLGGGRPTPRCAHTFSRRGAVSPRGRLPR